MLKAFAPACMTWPVMVGPLQEHQPQYCLSLFPSHRDQAKNSSSEVQLNVLFLGHCHCHRDRCSSFFGLPSNPIMSVMRCCTTRVPVPTQLQTMNPVRPDTVIVLLQWTQNPAWGLQTARQQLFHPGVHHIMDLTPSTLSRGLGWGFRNRDSYQVQDALLLSWDILRSHWTRLLMYQFMKKKCNFETHLLMKYKPVPWSWGNLCNMWKSGVRKQRQNFSAQAAHTT